MARKVYVSSEMGIDEAVFAVAEEDCHAALLWPWILTSFDDWGRAEASAHKLKSRIFPDWPGLSRNDLEHAIVLFAEHGLISLYEVDGKRYMTVNEDNWKRYQTHIRYDRKGNSRSQIPERPANESIPAVPGSSRQFPAVPGSDGNIPPSPSPSPSINTNMSVLSGEKTEKDERDEAKDEKDDTLPLQRGESRQVFVHWCNRCKKNANTKFDNKRQERVRWGLKTYGLDTCLAAIDGYARDGWAMADPVRHELTLIFRDAAHVEKHLTKPKSALELIDEEWGGGAE